MAKNDDDINDYNYSEKEREFELLLHIGHRPQFKAKSNNKTHYIH